MADGSVDDERVSPGIGAFWAAAFAGGALILLALTLGLSSFWLHEEREQTQVQALAAVKGLVQGLSSRTAAVRGQLNRWRDDPGLQTAIEDGRPAVLRAKEEELSTLVPGALGIDVFPASEVGPGGNAGNRLSYAGLDMVRSVADSGRIALLEAHRVHMKDEHLAIAAPIMRPAGDGVLGVVHVKLPLSMLPWIGQRWGDDARFAFQQQVGDDLVEIDDKGEALPNRVPDVSEPVSGTRIQVRAWVDPGGLFSRGRLPWVVGIYGVALLALGLIFWVVQRALKRALRTDLNALVATIDDAVQKRPPRVVRHRLAELQGVQDQVRRQLRELQSRPPAPRSAPAPDLAALAGAAEAAAEEGRDLDLEFDTDLDLSAPLDLAGDAPPDDEPPASPARPVQSSLPDDAIFRAYDIRGLVGSQLDADIMRMLGQALASEALARGSDVVIVGRDQRPSGSSLCGGLVEGLLCGGIDVIDLGLVPTPLVYYACSLRPRASGAVVTASHNPAEYNGLKVVLAGLPAGSEDITALRDRLHAGDLGEGQGNCREQSVIDDYIDAVEEDIAIARGLTIVVDCGHATASVVAPRLLRALGCEVIELDCNCDPALADERMPDPAQPRHLYSLGDAVRGAGADLGIAFDADGDRLGVVDGEGRVVAADRVLMLLAADILARQPGSDIVYDVKCSHHVGAYILQHGGRPVMWKSGHSHLKQKLRACNAPLAGEFTGHFMFAERWNGFDDAFYAAGRLLEVLALDPRPSAEVFAEVATGMGTPELFVPLPADETSAIMDMVLDMADQLDGVEVNTIDGLRAEFDQGWGLVRGSNTQSGLMFRFEADDKGSLHKIQDLFRRIMDLAAPRLELPF